MPPCGAAAAPGEPKPAAGALVGRGAFVGTPLWTASPDAVGGRPAAGGSGAGAGGLGSVAAAAAFCGVAVRCSKGSRSRRRRGLSFNLRVGLAAAPRSPGGQLVASCGEALPALKEELALPTLPIATRGRPLGMKRVSSYASQSTVCPDESNDFDLPSEWEHEFSTARTPAGRCAPPRRSELEDIFDRLSGRRTGAVGLEEMQGVVVALNSQFELGLGSEDGARLFAYLGGSEGHSLELQGGAVTKQQFVQGVLDLSELLHRVSDKITLRQMKVVLMHAFDQFDLDGDSSISVAELAAATRNFGLELGRDDVAHLHRFLAPNSSIEIVQESLIEEQSTLEKVARVARGSLGDLRGASALAAGAGQTLQRVCKAWATEADASKKAERALDALWSEGCALEGAFTTADLALDVSGVLVAVQYMNDSFGDILQAHALQHGVDAGSLVTLLACVGMCGVNVAKALDDLAVKEMSEGEALLFAQLFQRHGFGQSEFRHLLSCPGCEWSTVEPGEVLNAEGDTRLKIIVKGSASISIEGGPSVAMRPLSSIGETLFLRGRRLWTREVVVATERVQCVSWEPEQLRECLGHNRALGMHVNNVLSELMSSNLGAVSRLRSRLEAEGGHQTEACEVGVAGPEPRPAQSAGEARQVGGAELGLWISCLQRRLGLGEAGSEASGREKACLLAYLGVVDLGTKLDRRDVVERLRELDASFTALESAGLTLEELASVLSRSATTIDSNGDGAISREEFAAALHQVCHDFPEHSVTPLFLYFSAGDAFIPVKSLEETFCGHSMLKAVQSALNSEVQRKGLARCTYFAQQVSDALFADGSPLARAKRGLEAVFHGFDSFAETAFAANDVVGVGTFLACLWQELAGVASCDDLDDRNLAPFLVCLGMCGVHVTRRVAESRVSDMTERESLLYSKAFEGHGWTMTEFRNLLKHGGVQWEHFEPGDVVAQGHGDALQVVAKGSCEVWDTRRGVRRESLRPGAVRDQRRAGGAHVLRVTAPTTLATWDWHELRGRLGSHEGGLPEKLLRTAVASRADGLLDAYHGDRSSLEKAHLDTPGADSGSATAGAGRGGRGPAAPAEPGGRWLAAPAELRGTGGRCRRLSSGDLGPPLLLR